MTTQEKSLIHNLLVKVLDLDDARNGNGNWVKNLTAKEPTYLQSLIKDLAGDGTAGMLELQQIDQILLYRLYENPPEEFNQYPFHYLLGCLDRFKTQRDTLFSTNAQLEKEAGELLTDCRRTLLNYTVHSLVGSEIIAQPTNLPAVQAPALLRQSIRGQLGKNEQNYKHNLAKVNCLLLEEIVLWSRQVNPDQLPAVTEVLGCAVLRLSQELVHITILATYEPVLDLLKALFLNKVLAKQITKSSYWLMSEKRKSELQAVSRQSGPGRLFSLETVLGPIFALAAAFDPTVTKVPDIRRELFQNVGQKKGNNKEVQERVVTLQKRQKGVHEALVEITSSLLKTKETKQAMLSWFAQALAENSARSQMQNSPFATASQGFFFNLCSVLLKLCQPFFDPSKGKLERVDIRYLLYNQRYPFSTYTKVAMPLSEYQDLQVEFKESLEKNTSDQPQAPEYHFICECFYLTAVALHLGVARTLQDITQLGHTVQEWTQQQQDLERAGGNENQLHFLSQRLDMVHQRRLLLEVHLTEKEFVESVHLFYRLMACYLVRQAIPEYKVTSTNPQSMVKLPLKTPPPQSFRYVPEFFVEDLAEVLVYYSRVQASIPHPTDFRLGGPDFRREEIAQFITCMMSSPSYIGNPYLRARLAEVLYLWLPQKHRSHQWNSRRSSWNQLRDDASDIFEHDQIMQVHLVPSLVKLYVDIERTDRHNTFYEKFYMRMNIAEMLEYLWQIQVHKQVWLKLAKEHVRGIYLRFANMQVNDIIFLLDEALKNLKIIKEIEIVKEKPEEWDQLPENVREEQEKKLRSSGHHAKQFLGLARTFVRIVELGVHEESVCKVLLLPEMVQRMGEMLNYFLDLLVGEQRWKLKVKKFEQYNFNPKELLAQILTLYIYMDRQDNQKLFIKAVVSDERSYKRSNFDEAKNVVERHHLLSGEQMMGMTDLITHLEPAEELAREEDEMIMDLDDIVPDEFRDPITFLIMRDPVLMPTSNQHIERSTIRRHLLTDPRDPMNRMDLTPKDLQEAPELKTRINLWLTEQIAARSEAKAEQAKLEKEGNLGKSLGGAISSVEDNDEAVAGGTEGDPMEVDLEEF